MRTYEEQLAYNRAWRKANPDKAKAQERRKAARVKADPRRLARVRELGREAARRYIARHPERVAAQEAEYRARQKKLGYPAAKKSYIKNRAACISRSLACGKKARASDPAKWKARFDRYNRTPAQRWRRSKRAAAQRGLRFDFDMGTYLALAAGRCHYCGLPPANSTGGGLDRIDNSRGYEAGNVLPCCGPCNKIRGDNLTVDVMLAAMKVVQCMRLANALEGVDGALEQEERTFLTL